MRLRDEPSGALYFDARGWSWADWEFDVMVRTERGVSDIGPELREVVAALDPEIPLANEATMDDLVAAQLESSRAALGLMGLFSGVAGLLAFLGLYGVVAYSVRMRTRRLGSVSRWARPVRRRPPDPGAGASAHPRWRGLGSPGRPPPVRIPPELALRRRAHGPHDLPPRRRRPRPSVDARGLATGSPRRPSGAHGGAADRVGRSARSRSVGAGGSPGRLSFLGPPT